MAHPKIVSRPADVHATTQTKHAPSTIRPHRHRHSTTAATPASVTHSTPAAPDGTGTAAPGAEAAASATRSSHHRAGPVNLITRPARSGAADANAAAPVPSTVIGGMTTATARLAATDTTLKDPDIAATSGAVTRWAATATQTASASGLGHRRWTRRSDHAGAMTTSAAVAETDSAKPTSTAISGHPISTAMTVAASAGIAWRRRRDTMANNVIAAMLDARSTLAEGCTTITNAMSANAARLTATRGPTSAADNRTAPHTMVTLAPETAVRCVSVQTTHGRERPMDNDERTPEQRAAAGDLALAFQLLEIECAIHADGATDEDAHAFLDELTPDRRERVRNALRKILVYSSVGRPDLAGLLVAGYGKPIRELSIAVAMSMNFDRKVALAAATLGAERM